MDEGGVACAVGTVESRRVPIILSSDFCFAVIQFLKCSAFVHNITRVLSLVLRATLIPFPPLLSLPFSVCHCYVVENTFPKMSSLSFQGITPSYFYLPVHIQPISSIHYPLVGDIQVLHTYFNKGDAFLHYIQVFRLERIGRRQAGDWLCVFPAEAVSIGWNLSRDGARSGQVSLT